MNSLVAALPHALIAIGAGIGIAMVGLGFVAAAGEAVLAGIWVLAMAVAVAAVLDVFEVTTPP